MAYVLSYTALIETLIINIFILFNEKCKGDYPYYGCNPSFPLGYCNASGGCSYSSQTANDPNWCCFKGC